MKILVTGANGQLGSELKVLAKNMDWNFTFTDIEELDLFDTANTEKFISDLKPDYLINCAAYTAVDKAESDVEVARKLNASVPGELARISNKNSIKLIHVSTDYVFSGKSCTPLHEGENTNPPSAYGKTKLEGENLVMNNADAIIIRTSWLYSIFGNNFVKSMLRLGKERDTLGVVFDQIGTPTNAADLASTIVNIIKHTENKKEWHSGIYHYSNEGVCSWFDFAVEIMKFGNISCSVNPISSDEYPLPAPRPSFSVMDKKKIKTTFNIEIPFWRDSLKGVVNKILNQE